jgi:hypothetical protein
MALKRYRSFLIAGLAAWSFATVQGQVFVVGEKSATADIATDFTPTHLALPDGKLGERGRRELVRNLEAEQGFAHRALPVSAALALRANGPLTPGPADYRKLIYEKGQAAAAGDRVVITAVDVKPDRIILDLNGGPYVKHRFLRHVQFNDMPVTPVNDDRATGSRVTLVFEGQVPEISAPEVKALLEPVIDFGVKTSEQAYADTLPPMLKEAIAAHEVLVGMNRRMVLAAMGAPENKIRDQPTGDANGGRCEEWIFGHVPQTVRFVRFVGDRVTVVEIAALGKPIEIHDKNEMGDYDTSGPVREVALGDRKPVDGSGSAAPPPSLRRPGEAAPANGPDKVQFPDDKKAGGSQPPAAIPPPPNFVSVSSVRPSTNPAVPPLP